MAKLNPTLIMIGLLGKVAGLSEAATAALIRSAGIDDEGLVATYAFPERAAMALSKSTAAEAIEQLSPEKIELASRAAEALQLAQAEGIDRAEAQRRVESAHVMAEHNKKSSGTTTAAPSYPGTSIPYEKPPAYLTKIVAAQMASGKRII